MQVYRCNDHVPEAVYYELPKRIQEQVQVPKYQQYSTVQNTGTNSVVKIH